MGAHGSASTHTEWCLKEPLPTCSQPAPCRSQESGCREELQPPPQAGLCPPGCCHPAHLLPRNRRPYSWWSPGCGKWPDEPARHPGLWVHRSPQGPVKAPAPRHRQPGLAVAVCPSAARPGGVSAAPRGRAGVGITTAPISGMGAGRLRRHRQLPGQSSSHLGPSTGWQPCVPCTSGPVAVATTPRSERCGDRAPGTPAPSASRET